MPEPAPVDVLQSVSQYTFMPAPARAKGPNLLGIGLVLGFLLTSGLLMSLSVLIQGFGLGWSGALIGIVAASLPAPFYLLLWLWLDRNDPEPEWAILLAYAWGGGVGTFIALILNSLMQIFISLALSRQIADVLVTVFCAPVIEETAKGAAVLGIYLFMRREMGTVVDGILYAGVVALGFATIENVGYYGRSFHDGGFGQVLLVFFLRGVLSPFSHAFFTSMTGLGCGLARESRKPLVRWLLPPLGLAAAIFFHMLWNGLACVTGQFGLVAFLITYTVVWAPLFLIFFALAVYLGFREKRIIRQMLEHDVARGRLSAEHVAMACSMFKSVPWVLQALGDPARLQARRRFLRLVTQLALCRWHSQNALRAREGTISFDQGGKIQQELQELRLHI